MAMKILFDLELIPYDVIDGICKVLRAMPNLTTLLAVQDMQWWTIMELGVDGVHVDFSWLHSEEDKSSIQFYDDVPTALDTYLRRNEEQYKGSDPTDPEMVFCTDLEDLPFKPVFSMREHTVEQIVQRKLAETSGAKKTPRRGGPGRRKRA